MELGGAQLGCSRFQRVAVTWWLGLKHLGPGRTSLPLHDLRAFPCGLSAWASLGFFTAWRLRAPAGVFYRMEVFPVSFQERGGITSTAFIAGSESPTRPGSRGGELDSTL